MSEVAFALPHSRSEQQPNRDSAALWDGLSRYIDPNFNLVPRDKAQSVITRPKGNGLTVLEISLKQEERDGSLPKSDRIKFISSNNNLTGIKITMANGQTFGLYWQGEQLEILTSPTGKPDGFRKLMATDEGVLGQLLFELDRAIKIVPPWRQELKAKLKVGAHTALTMASASAICGALIWGMIRGTGFDKRVDQYLDGLAQHPVPAQIVPSPETVVTVRGPKPSPINRQEQALRTERRQLEIARQGLVSPLLKEAHTSLGTTYREGTASHEQALQGYLALDSASKILQLVNSRNNLELQSYVFKTLKISPDLIKTLASLLHTSPFTQKEAAQVAQVIFMHNGQQPLDLAGVSKIAQQNWHTPAEFGIAQAQQNWHTPGLEMQLVHDVQLLQPQDYVIAYDPTNPNSPGKQFTVLSRGKDVVGQMVAYILEFNPQTGEYQVVILDNRQLEKLSISPNSMQLLTVRANSKVSK
jgi:hypothetical protein